jgi:hypothetical protein
LLVAGTVVASLVIAAVHGLYNASLVCLVVIGPTLG